jgi:hypothetical protein
MEYYRLTIPIPKQPWLWVRFRITTILLLIAILAILLTWRRDHQQLAAEIYRMRNPGPHYEAAQATGPPDATNQGDSSRAWCPATMDAGNEWLQLDYDEPIAPTSIIVYENYTPGGVARITHFPILGKETTLWEGTYSPTGSPTGSVVQLPITTSVMTKRIRVYLDTKASPGWHEIDAVGLVDANGNVHWARGAKASSTWGESSTGGGSQSNWAVQIQ